MTVAQQEAMDIIVHMSAKELSELAGFILIEVEKKLAVDRAQKLIDSVRMKQVMQRSKIAKDKVRRQGL